MELLPSLLVVDIQEKLFAKILNHEMLLQKVLLMISSFQELKLPIFITEQYPKGLGPTVEPIKSILHSIPYEKTKFSACHEGLKGDSFVLVGIEAHVCMLQTAKEMRNSGREVIVPVDATSSRSKVDYETALKELDRIGARLTTCETLLFELLQDAKHPQFKAISALIK